MNDLVPAPAFRRKLAFSATVTSCAILIALLFSGCGLLEALLTIINDSIAPPTTLVGLQLVADGLVAPVGLVEPPDGTKRLFVVDQIGQIRVIDSSGNLLTKPFIDLADRMVAINQFSDERGLLGMAFHPQYATNGKFYVYYNADKQNDIPMDFDSEIHVSEFSVMNSDANCADPASEKLVLRFGKPQPNHNGGQLAFGPDGYLYIATGDGGGAHDFGGGHNPTIGNGQDKASFLGKILRISVDGAQPYEIPPTNPFVGQAGTLEEIFALGFRNPWRFSFDQGGEHRLFAADVGQSLLEEVDIVTSGGNYGWRIREGRNCFDLNDPSNPPETCDSVDADGAALLDPIVQYPHEDPLGGPRGIAIIGGFVYRGTAIPGLVGKYIFGDYSTTFFFADGSIFAATEGLTGQWTLAELGLRDSSNLRLGRLILGFGQDSAGEVYVLTTATIGPSGTTGQVYKLIP